MLGQEVVAGSRQSVEAEMRPKPWDHSGGTTETKARSSDWEDANFHLSILLKKKKSPDATVFAVGVLKHQFKYHIYWYPFSKPDVPLLA